jgi:hypothetical protein
MPKQSHSTLFVERLKRLLSERQALHPMLARYRAFLNSNSFNERRTKLEEEAFAIVAAGLFFDEHERRYNLPQAGHVVEALANLQTWFVRPELQDAPNFIWNYGSPVPGVLTANWHPAVKERIIALVGPLDSVLKQMLAL